MESGLGWILTRAPGAKGDGKPGTVFKALKAHEDRIDLATARELVGGASLVEAVGLAFDPETGRTIDLICDEEGKFKRLPPALGLVVEANDGTNRERVHDYTAGPVAVVAATPEGEWVPLTDAEVERAIGMLTGIYTIHFGGGGMVPHLAPAAWEEVTA